MDEFPSLPPLMGGEGPINTNKMHLNIYNCFAFFSFFHPRDTPSSATKPQRLPVWLLSCFYSISFWSCYIYTSSEEKEQNKGLMTKYLQFFLSFIWELWVCRVESGWCCLFLMAPIEMGERLSFPSKFSLSFPFNSIRTYFSFICFDIVSNHFLLSFSILTAKRHPVYIT